MIRKIATAARITMIRVAEPMLRPKKILSSGRALDFTRAGPAPRGERGPVADGPLVTPGDFGLAVGEPVVLVLTDFFLAQAKSRRRDRMAAGYVLQPFTA